MASQHFCGGRWCRAATAGESERVGRADGAAVTAHRARRSRCGRRGGNEGFDMGCVLSRELLPNSVSASSLPVTQCDIHDPVRVRTMQRAMQPQRSSALGPRLPRPGPLAAPAARSAAAEPRAYARACAACLTASTWDLPLPASGCWRLPSRGGFGCPAVLLHKRDKVRLGHRLGRRAPPVEGCGWIGRGGGLRTGGRDDVWRVGA